MNTPPNLEFQKAYDFYRKFILEHSLEKQAVYEEYGFPLQGSVGSRDWEVFAAILLSDKKKPGDGSDLERHEVKSATEKGSFEYQYHRNTGQQKLQEDQSIDHVFVWYSSDYSDVQVWLIEKTNKELQETFDSWEPELILNYATEEKQRFRKALSRAFIKRNGFCILSIQNGQLQSNPLVSEL